jgi:hypothetical protein
MVDLPLGVRSDAGARSGPLRSRVVVVGDCPERLLRLPRHVGVGRT